MSREKTPETPAESQAKIDTLHLSRHMQEAGNMVEGWLKGQLDGREHGFLMILFPLGSDEHALNYLSNGQREDIIKMLTEFLEAFKADETDTPLHEKH